MEKIIRELKNKVQSEKIDADVFRLAELDEEVSCSQCCSLHSGGRKSDR